MSVDLSSEQRELRERAREFSKEHIRPASAEYVDSGEWPWDLFEAAADAGLIGLWIDERYGGQGKSLVEQCLVDEEFARGDSNIGLALHSSVIGCHVVSKFGTHQQKERWIPPVTRGDVTTSLGLTEPETGSALQEVSTTAERDGDEYVINGAKRWVGNGSRSDWVATLCRTDTDVESGKEGLSIVVVPTDTEGFTGTPIEKMGLMGNDHAELTYDDVRVPAENLLGEEEGQGFYQVLDWLNEGHGRIAVAAVSVGQALGALDRAREYAEQREQGGQPISDYQGMRWKFADMKTQVEVARSQLYRAARVATAHADGDAESVDENLIEQASIAKLYASEMADDVAREAVQVFGGNGYAKEYGVEHIYRDAKAGTLYEGTSEVLRNTIGKTVFGEL
ncbi:MAG: acyl-CoA dehydrogenase family protein [Halolamina sp.]